MSDTIGGMTHAELLAFIGSQTNRSALPPSLVLKQLAVIEQAGFFGAAPTYRPIVSGSRSSGAALVSLLAALSQLGLIYDQTTA